MPRMIEGHLSAAGLRFGILASRFHDAVMSQLLAGAMDCLRRHGASDEDLLVVRVPGAFELPLVAQTLASRGKHDAIVALGVLIRGATPHFDFLASAVTTRLAETAAHSQVPIAFGVLTCDTAEQARERAGGKAGNKGVEAALAAIEMANLLRSLSTGQ